MVFVLLLFIAASVGVSVYDINDNNSSLSIRYDKNDPFNNIVFSILTTFQIASGQNWVDILSKTTQLFDGDLWSGAYFMSIVILGVFLFPNWCIGSVLGSIEKHQNDDSVCHWNLSFLFLMSPPDA